MLEHDLDPVAPFVAAFVVFDGLLADLSDQTQGVIPFAL